MNDQIGAARIQIISQLQPAQVAGFVPALDRLTVREISGRLRGC